MTKRNENIPAAIEDVAALADLTEEITCRLESGEPLNVDDMDDDPARAGSIRELLPTLQTMVSLGEQVAREEGLRARLQKKKNRTLSSFLNMNPEVEEIGP